MDLSAVFFILAVLILVAMYLYAPLLSRTQRSDAHEQHELSSLMAERDRVINALQELDFDHTLGKIPAEDYPIQRAELLKKGADILRQLDTFPSTGTGAVRRDASAEDRLERAAAVQRADGVSLQDAPVAVKEELTDDDIESMLASRRKLRTEKAAGFCPRCGQPVLVSDRFCPACGKAL